MKVKKMDTIFISDFKNEKFISAFKSALHEFSVDLSKFDSYIEGFNAAENTYAFVLVTQQGEAIGMIQFQKTKLSNQDITMEYGFIREFWIAPAYRKKGYGSILLKETEYYFIKNDISVIILSSRPESIEFYIKNGYKEKKNAQSFNKLTVMEKQI